MKYFILITAILIIFSGCSSTTETNATTNGANPSAPNSNQANSNSSAATNSNPPGMQPYNGVQNLNPNAFNATNDNLKVIRVEPKKDEMPYGSRLAPDDSIITSGSRGKDFLETRTFKSDPTIAKVEKIMDGKTTKYKVYLKNGKVVDAPADKMTEFAAMAPANILDAIGMLPKPQTNPQPNSEPKKDQKQ
jgi:PBP1b-binding outer membrane lipoprotein LpoB